MIKFNRFFCLLIPIMMLGTECTAATWVIEPQYQTTSQFSEGIANCSVYTMFVNRKGEILYEYPDTAPRFSSLFSEGISIGTDSKTGSSDTHIAMGKDGSSHEISGYSVINDFSCGMALVANEDKSLYGYINKSFENVIPMIYVAAKNFNEGFAAVKSENGYWSYINKDGDVVIDGSFLEANDFSDGLAAVKDQNGLWGYIDYSGNYVIEPKFNKADIFSDEMAVIQDEVGSGFIDKGGNITYIPENIIAQNPFYNNVSVVFDGTKYGLIDKKGNIITDFKWDYMSDCCEGIITAMNNGICYILNSDGEIIDTTDAIEIKKVSENLINASKANSDGEILWGYIRNPLATPSEWSNEIIEDMFEDGYMTDDISYDYQDNITRQDFCVALTKAIERKMNITLPIDGGKGFSDTKDINISKLVNAGIIDGISDTEFAPDDYLTREQAAKIFMYMGNKYGVLDDIVSETKFVDDADISDWAYEAVYLMQGNGVMNGYEDGGFRPYIFLTKEQSIAMLYRFLNKF